LPEKRGKEKKKKGERGGGRRGGACWAGRYFIFLFSIDAERKREGR